jgi:hypothetical protein
MKRALGACALVSLLASGSAIGTQSVARAAPVSPVRRFAPVYMEGAKHFTLAQAQAIASANDLIVDKPGDLTPWLSAMKTVNPSVVVLAYVNGMFAGTATEYPSSWYARSASGQLVRSNNFGNYLIDPSTALWRANRVQACSQLLQASPGYDGCFVDVVGSGVLSAGYLTAAPINHATGKAWTTTQWVAATSSIYKAIVASQPTKTMMSNGIGNGTRWDTSPTSQGQLVARTGYVMGETWLRAEGSPLSDFELVPNWIADVTLASKVSALSGNLVVTVKTWAPGSAQQIDQWHYYSLATFLLATGGKASYAFLTNTTTAPAANSQTDHPALGAPSGAMMALTNGIYTRHFIDGLVAVNPTGGSLQLTLTTTYHDQNGVKSGTITLGPHTGEVLLLGAA